MYVLYIRWDCQGDLPIQEPVLDSDRGTVKHLNLWDVKGKPPACANSPPVGARIISDQTSSPGADDTIIDADDPIDLSRRSSTCWVVLSRRRVGS